MDFGIGEERFVRRTSSICHRIVHHIEQEHPCAKPDQPGKGSRSRLSLMICEIISKGFAPIARRTPISRVRSRTVTIIILLTPMIPASKVPIPTSQTSILIPVNSMSNVSNCLAIVKLLMACSSVGEISILRTQDRLYIFHHLVARVTVVGRRTQEPELVSLVGSLLEGLERDHHALLRTPADLGTGLRLDHADHLVIDAVHPYVLPRTGSSSGAKRTSRTILPIRHTFRFSIMSISFNRRPARICCVSILKYSE